METVKNKWIAAVQKRPLGVSILAGAAFLASAASIFYSIAMPFVILGGRNDLTVGGGFYTRGAFALLLTSCFLSLAWISGAAGMDLWALRKRGRSLTIISMCMFSALGVAMAAVPGGIVSWAGFAVCALSIWAVVYLFLPSIRGKFEEASLTKRNEQLRKPKGSDE